MKIAFVCNEYPEARRGGQGVVIHSLARALVVAGHQVRVIGFYDRRHLTPDGTDSDGVFQRNLPRGHYPLSWLPARRHLFCELRNWARRGEIDLIELPLSQGLAAGWRSLPVPVVVRLHGSNVLRAKILGEAPPRWHTRLEHGTLARADARVAVSSQIANYARTIISTDSIPIIANPIDCTPPAWHGIDSRDIIFAGNIHPIKGVPELLRAWPAVHSRHPDATLHLCGRGKPPPLPAGVIAHGHIPQAELHARFAAARAAVFPSRFEAFGLAALEAMACGCPTIVTRDWGAKFGAANEQLLFADDISSQLDYLLTDNAVCQRLSRNAAESAKPFHIDSILPENVAFWQQVIAEFGKTT